MQANGDWKLYVADAGPSDGTGFLFGGHTNGHAFTDRHLGILGFNSLSRDLHPRGYLSSRVESVSLTTNGANGSLRSHACVWFRDYPFEASYSLTDIHPTNFTDSRALGVGDAFWGAHSDSAAQKRLVGDGRVIGYSDYHALIWNWHEQFIAHDVHPAGY